MPVEIERQAGFGKGIAGAVGRRHRAAALPVLVEYFVARVVGQRALDVEAGILREIAAELQRVRRRGGRESGQQQRGEQ
ncbi:MAG: hypothetical protein NVS9B10_16840 [Nevskia sp.]